MSKMIVEKVFSPYDDKNLKDNLQSSEIWKKAFKEEELTKEIKAEYQFMYLYRIKFDGLKPVQLLTKKMVKF